VKKGKTPKLLLAEKYVEGKSKIDGWWMSEKLVPARSLSPSLALSNSLSLTSYLLLILSLFRMGLGPIGMGKAFSRGMATDSM